MLSSPIRFQQRKVKFVLFQMPPSKSLGPDRMTTHFFQKYWHVVGNDATSAVQSFFHSGKLLKGINHSHVTLVPKVKCPMNMTQLRPINLCNVTYKILSKVLANRLCAILPSIISENQGAFVLGRFITDNILIGQEVLHHMKSKQSG